MAEIGRQVSGVMQSSARKLLGGCKVKHRELERKQHGKCSGSQVSLACSTAVLIWSTKMVFVV